MLFRSTEIYNGYYLEIHWGKLTKTIAAIYHLDYNKVRTNKDNTQFWVADEWKEYSQTETKSYLAFNPEIREGVQILYVKQYSPGKRPYAIPNYIAAINYIQSDIEVSKHVLGNASTGFTPSKLITLVNGEPPTNEAKRSIEKIGRAHV